MPRLDRPTAVVFDLDPGEGSDLAACADVAFLIKAMLDRLGLKAFPKVSGSKGLQVYVPLNSKVTYGSTGAFAKAVAEILEQEHPEVVVSRMAKIRRRGRVLIDWSQNSASKTTVSVYSVRGKQDEPFVSMPVTWDETAEGGKANRPCFSAPTAAIKRLRKVGDLFAPVLTLQAGAAQGLSPRKCANGEPPLERYREKRDFTKTREPPPRPSGLQSGEGRTVRHPEARGLPPALRFPPGDGRDPQVLGGAQGPADGAGRQAVGLCGRGPSLGYIKFEGTIPKGQYGGGTVMVWDIGTYDLLGGDYADGKPEALLHGKKLKGEWHMFKIRSEGGKDVWLIAKSKVAAKAVDRAPGGQFGPHARGPWRGSPRTTTRSGRVRRADAVRGSRRLFFGSAFCRTGLTDHLAEACPRAARGRRAAAGVRRRSIRRT